MMIKHVLVPIADGTEEIEAVTIIDVLRRAGADVTVASVNDLQVTASRGVRLVADCLIGQCVDRDHDLVVLPGGMPGAEHLRDSRELKRILQHHSDAGRLLGAICAAPAVVLEPHGLLENRKATCHPNHVQRWTVSFWWHRPWIRKLRPSSIRSLTEPRPPGSGISCSTLHWGWTKTKPLPCG
jgi:4-methyl-5(b-hydroxyethyl)-thiazole monophosphate biosynthesis